MKRESSFSEISFSFFQLTLHWKKVTFQIFYTGAVKTTKYVNSYGENGIVFAHLLLTVRWHLQYVCAPQAEENGAIIRAGSTQYICDLDIILLATT